MYNDTKVSIYNRISYLSGTFFLKSKKRFLKKIISF